MNSDLARAMTRALEQTRASDPAGATATIQAALSGRGTPAPEAPAAEAATAERPRATAAPGARAAGGRSARTTDIPDAEIVDDQPGPRRPRRMSKVLAGLAETRRAKPSARPAPAIPAGARYERRNHAAAQGARDYALYVPAALPDGAPRGLIVMLHGCTQDADDFARGTAMNALAETHGLIIAYPEQPRSQNAQGCWNWFQTGDQSSGAGEPELLADLARKLTGEFGIDPAHVFVAGLSAGGAMAAILGVTHPEVFRAVGIHSGLPHGSAHDVISAFSAMRGQAGAGIKAPDVPSFIIHGSADQTVHRSNAERMFSLKLAQGQFKVAERRKKSGALVYQRIATDGSGRPWAELWIIEGAGHAWSGGTPQGSYTDANGPDASAEMVRFFLEVAA